MSTLVTPPFAGAAPVPLDPTSGAFPRPFRWTADALARVTSTGVFGGRRPVVADGDLWEDGRQLRWTADEFDRVGDCGIWEGWRPFLVGGVIWEQGMMNTPHASGIRRLNRVLGGHTPAGHHAQMQLPVRLGDDTELIPDGAIVPGHEGDYDHAHPTRALLVVEVSDSTLRLDRTTKAELYATAGIPTYWIVDLENRLLRVFTDPQPLPPGGVAYRSHVEYTEADSVPGPDGRPVAVAALLPPAG